MPIRPEDHACPDCLGSLVREAAALRCPGCGASYPVVAGTIPVLLEAPDAWIARSWAALRERAAEIGAHASEVRRAVDRAPGRRAALERIADASAANGDLLLALAGTLRPHVSPESALRAGRARDAEGAYPAEVVTRQLFTYLVRDWSRFPEAEEEVAAIEAALSRSLDAARPPAGNALVLGAGGGRFARDLAPRFPRVHAVDRSLAMALAYERLAREGAVLHEITTANAYKTTGQVRRVEARVPPPAPGEGGVRYSVADAAALPFPDGSFAAVVSIYFTDCIPLAALLPEVARVLAPGGAFFHFGPLGYAFDDPAAHLSAEEVRERVRAAGLDLREEGFVPTAHCGSAVRMGSRRFDSWTFVAVRGEAAAPAAIDDATVLSIAGPVEVESRTVITDASERVLETAARLPSGRRIDLGDVAAEVLRAADGETPLGAILSALEEAHGPLAERRPDLHAMVRRMVRAGALRVVAG